MSKETPATLYSYCKNRQLYTYWPVTISKIYCEAKTTTTKTKMQNQLYSLLTFVFQKWRQWVRVIRTYIVVCAWNKKDSKAANGEEMFHCLPFCVSEFGTEMCFTHPKINKFLKPQGDFNNLGTSIPYGTVKYENIPSFLWLRLQSKV